MATLFELAEEMITDETKEQWLRQYLAEPANLNKFMEKWLEKTTAESVKRGSNKKAPPKIE